MKMRETFAIVALGVAFQAVAAPATPNTPPTKPQPQNSPSAAAVISKKDFRWFTPSPSTKNGQIERVGTMSSRPWTAIMGWHPGGSAFPSGETQEPQLVLLSVNF
jgi:hypothetical protein